MKKPLIIRPWQTLSSGTLRVVEDVGLSPTSLSLTSLLIERQAVSNYAAHFWSSQDLFQTVGLITTPRVLQLDGLRC